MPIVIDMSQLRCPICRRVDWARKNLENDPRDLQMPHFEWQPLAHLKVPSTLVVHCRSCENTFLAGDLKQYWSDQETWEPDGATPPPSREAFLAWAKGKRIRRKKWPTDLYIEDCKWHAHAETFQGMLSRDGISRTLSWENWNGTDWEEYTGQDDDKLKQLRQENETLRKRIAKLREVMQAAVVDLQVHSQPEAGDNATTLEVRDLDDGQAPTKPKYHFRPPIATFAAAMEEKLRAHAEKWERCGWRETGSSQILNELSDAVDELNKANTCYSPSYHLLIMDRCVDVANIALMLYNRMSLIEGPTK